MKIMTSPSCGQRAVLQSAKSPYAARISTTPEAVTEWLWSIATRIALRYWRWKYRKVYGARLLTIRKEAKVNHLLEAISHLQKANAQRIPSDDLIIAYHTSEALRHLEAHRVTSGNAEPASANSVARKERQR